MAKHYQSPKTTLQMIKQIRPISREVLNYNNACEDNPFMELGQFVISFLTLPISTAISC